MKKFLFLLLAMAVAVSASAGVDKAPLQKKLAPYSVKAKTELVTPFKARAVEKKQAFKAPVTEQPAGEVKTYLREGECLAVVDGYIEHLEQDGFITLIFAENNIVWFKNIFYLVGENFGDSYVYGVLSEDGTKITVPMGQSIYYSDYYSADVVLSFGTSSVGASSINWTPDPNVTEVVYAIEGNKIVLTGCGGAAPSGSAYPEYEYNGLGSVWTDDGTIGGYVEWETVFTYVVIPDVPVIAVEPGVTTANVTWAADEKAEGWDLRYRPWKDLSGNPHQWVFTLDGYEDDLNEGFWAQDLDGDGYGWGMAYSSSAQDDACLYSYSWSSSTGALSPDNIIATPDVPLKGVLRFTVWGTSDSWPDTYMVYAMVGEDLYALFDADQQTTAAHRDVEIDLSQFNGEIGCIVFRHYNCYNQYAIYIDDIFIGDPNAEIIQPEPWTYAYGLETNEYTIEGLTPDTKYEVQVLGYNDNYESAWCDIVEFTTLPEPPDVYMLGGDDQGWDCTNGVKFEYNAEDNIYTLTYTFPAEYNYFGFTTELAENNDDGGWNYIEPFRFGAIAEEGTDYWYTGEEDFISLTWDAYHAIRIPAGEYKMTIDLEMMRLIIEDLNPQPQGLRGDVDNDTRVTIDDVTALIDYLLGTNTNINEGNADCDLSGGISIDDVTTLIDFLLTGNWPE